MAHTNGNAITKLSNRNQHKQCVYAEISGWRRETAESLLQRQVVNGLQRRLNMPTLPTHYVERVNYELHVIQSMGYSDYFLIVADFMRFARESQILTGPGRGSSASSLVAFALEITQVDPLQYDLLFERFLNPERITLPDIDIDF